MFEIPPAIPGVPTTWEGHAYGRDGESIGALNFHEQEIIRSLTRPDWSGEICHRASLEDLDPAAVTRARVLFKEKNPKIASEVDGWDTVTFLNKSQDPEK